MAKKSGPGARLWVRPRPQFVVHGGRALLLVGPCWMMLAGALGLWFVVAHTPLFLAKNHPGMVFLAWGYFCGLVVLGTMLLYRWLKQALGHFIAASLLLRLRHSHAQANGLAITLYTDGQGVWLRHGDKWRAWGAPWGAGLMLLRRWCVGSSSFYTQQDAASIQLPALTAHACMAMRNPRRQGLRPCKGV